MCVAQQRPRLAALILESRRDSLDRWKEGLAGNPKAKTTVELTPKQPLQLAVDRALAALGLGPPSHGRLLHGGKELDLAQPLRFAGLPANASLVLDTGAPV